MCTSNARTGSVQCSCSRRRVAAGTPTDRTSGTTRVSALAPIAAGTAEDLRHCNKTGGSLCLCLILVKSYTTVSVYYLRTKISNTFEVKFRVKVDYTLG